MIKKFFLTPSMQETFQTLLNAYDNNADSANIKALQDFFNDTVKQTDEYKNYNTNAQIDLDYINNYIDYEITFDNTFSSIVNPYILARNNVILRQNIVDFNAFAQCLQTIKQPYSSLQVQQDIIYNILQKFPNAKSEEVVRYLNSLSNQPCVTINGKLQKVGDIFPNDQTIIDIFNKYQEYKKDGYKNPDVKVYSWLMKEPQYQIEIEPNTIRKIVSLLSKEIKEINTKNK